MKKPSKLPDKWVLPILTTAVILMAICLPERISALRDRSLFAAAHVETYDSTQGISGPAISLAQRLQAMADLNFGEVTDAYIRYQDSFSQEEIDKMDEMFFTAAQKLWDNDVLRFPEGCALGDMECYACEQALLWDSVTMGNAVIVQMHYYHEETGTGIYLALDEESGLPIMLTMFSPEMESMIADDSGRVVASMTERFVEPFGFEIIGIKYDEDDTYIRLQTDEGELFYHASQKYDVLTIEPIPSGAAEAYLYEDVVKNSSTSISVDSPHGEVVYDYTK